MPSIVMFLASIQGGDLDKVSEEEMLAGVAARMHELNDEQLRLFSKFCSTTVSSDGKANEMVLVPYKKLADAARAEEDKRREKAELLEAERIKALQLTGGETLKSWEIHQSAAAKKWAKEVKVNLRKAAEKEAREVERVAALKRAHEARMMLPELTRKAKIRKRKWLAAAFVMMIVAVLVLVLVSSAVARGLVGAALIAMSLLCGGLGRIAGAPPSLEPLQDINSGKMKRKVKRRQRRLLRGVQVKATKNFEAFEKHFDEEMAAQTSWLKKRAENRRRRRLLKLSKVVTEPGPQEEGTEGAVDTLDEMESGTLVAHTAPNTDTEGSNVVVEMSRRDSSPGIGKDCGEDNVEPNHPLSRGTPLEQSPKCDSDIV